MANKNITMRILDDDGAYDKLYPQTSATQSQVSADTQQLFGQSTVDACLDKLADAISTLGRVVVKIVDVDGNPVQGATITGLGSGTVVTNASGQAGGILVTNPISITSPYADMKNTTADVKDNVGSSAPVVITLPSVAENEVVRYSTSRSVKFSNRVNTIDICCVGAGGGGGASGSYSISTSTGYLLNACTGAGGGGGDVKNSLGVSVTANTNYPIVVGAGGAAGLYNNIFTDGRTSGDGGTTSFMGLSATGGYGGNGWDVGWYYDDSVWAQDVVPQAATQGGLGGGVSQTIVRAYTISGATRFSSGWLTSTKDSTTPLNPQVGILYRVKYDITQGTTNISNLNGFYVWDGSKYVLADMTTLSTVGGNGGNGYAIVDKNTTIIYNPSDGIASSSAAVEFNSTTKQCGGGAGGSRTTAALTPGAPNGGAGGTTTASYGGTGGYGGGGGGAGYVGVSTDYNDEGGNSGGTGGSGMVVIRFHLK